MCRREAEGRPGWSGKPPPSTCGDQSGRWRGSPAQCDPHIPHIARNEAAMLHRTSSVDILSRVVGPGSRTRTNQCTVCRRKPRTSLLMSR